MALRQNMVWLEQVLPFPTIIYNGPKSPPHDIHQRIFKSWLADTATLLYTLLSITALPFLE